MEEEGKICFICEINDIYSWLFSIKGAKVEEVVAAA